MADQEGLSELPPPPAFHGPTAAAAADAWGFVGNIDKKLLVDARKLVIGPMISEGHHSVVYEGRYKSTPVAVKVMPSDMPSPESQQGKLNREVLMLSRVKHDNVVKFIGVVLEPTLMIITELMRGGTLQKYLWSVRPNRLDLKVSIRFALKISQAMEYLHQNRIIHRDLKPSNLLLTEDHKKIKIADFGSAREVSDDEMTVEVGTYRWMAPEMFNVDGLRPGAKKHYDHRVDVYSFAMVLWELLTNRTPFKGRDNILVAYAAAMNRRPSVDDIPAGIAPFLKSCWAENPEDRPEFQQITKFLEDFLRAMTKPSPRLSGAEHSSSNVEKDEESTGAECSPEQPKKFHRSFSVRLFHRLGRCF
ncbi:serine/threonine-protein kinase STY13-like [Andrographis paniculata]|uniref:serine/threonine-protein kinase STY13-like n=1 Tax=Andrographis paniculata TaxID=175694 RepID=UPI0021E83F7F|nr:serine/threonine-protein kinase STY13-like [Andrographis paniculata]